MHMKNVHVSAQARASFELRTGGMFSWKMLQIIMVLSDSTNTKIVGCLTATKWDVEVRKRRAASVRPCRECVEGCRIGALQHGMLSVPVAMPCGCNWLQVMQWQVWSLDRPSDSTNTKIVGCLTA
eukprot:363563-Chlamydomonas_euryale.AAC.5